MTKKPDIILRQDNLGGDCFIKIDIDAWDYMTFHEKKIAIGILAELVSFYIKKI